MRKLSQASPGGPGQEPDLLHFLRKDEAGEWCRDFAVFSGMKQTIKAESEVGGIERKVYYWAFGDRELTLDHQSLMMLDPDKRGRGGERLLRLCDDLTRYNPALGHYYVSAMDEGRTYLLLGPFACHVEALKRVGETRDYAKGGDPRAHFMAFGTVGLRGDEALKPGRANAVLLGREDQGLLSFPVVDKKSKPASLGM